MTKSKIELIAARIKRIRRKHGLTQAQFASRIGTTKPIISMIESNKIHCSFHHLERICEVFDINLNSLIK